MKGRQYDLSIPIMYYLFSSRSRLHVSERLTFHVRFNLHDKESTQKYGKE
jgi:hypothetical protein